MCLGIPGQITAITDPARFLGLASVSGVKREVSLAPVATGPLEDLLGQWALIHVGFAMSLIDEDEAQKTLEALYALGEAQAEIEAMQAGVTGHAQGEN